MFCSATSSSWSRARSRARSRATARARVLGAAWALALLWTVGVCPPAAAKVFLTVEESLELAFPGCEVRKETLYLTPDQEQRAEKLAGVSLRSSIIHRYRAFRGEDLQGTAYFDTHRVRTLAETLMVVVDPSGATSRLEILSFKEPEDYIPRDIWYRQFDGKPLSEDLRLKQDIRGVTGATLTARATTEAVRRVLALHQILDEETPPEDKKPAAQETGGEKTGDKNSRG